MRLTAAAFLPIQPERKASTIKGAVKIAHQLMETTARPYTVIQCGDKFAAISYQRWVMHHGQDDLILTVSVGARLEAVRIPEWARDIERHIQLSQQHKRLRDHLGRVERRLQRLERKMGKR